ncbi:VWA domain-containing protein [Lamprobacter modestohalophilus]|uniref:cobaltochelatase CobT-related protein n=1 Tax=Lamprobacter modestohalophilus TaxID=1064514 RepID=UPI002ADEB121|nr:VWA domain-containing protein [Lamprobacter modestohalophilus]MEA1049090.1 VWA domain-containing protein [Lamprobacter modestohalophilus]
MTLNTLNQALPIVAAAYGRKFGVAVQVGGSEAKTDGRIIHLPSLSGEAEKTLAYGYLAHEAGHVRLTDFSLRRHAQPLGRFFEGVLEDVRIETAMIRAYPGTRSTLDAVIDHLIADGRMRAVSADDPPAQLLGNALLMLARHRYREQPALAPQAQVADQVLAQVFGRAFVTQLRALMTEIPALRDTAETMALAQRMLALVESAAQHDAPRTESAERSTEREAPNTQSSEPSTENDGRSTEPEAPSTQRDAPSTDGEAPGTQHDAPSTEYPEPSTESDVLGAKDEAQKAAQEALSATDQALPDDLFEVIGAALQAQAGSSHGEMPTVETFEGDAVRGIIALQRAKGHSAQLSARLQGVVQSERLTRSRTVRQGRMLSAQHLHRAGVGDARIFRQRDQQTAPNTALHLLVDLSGSMLGGADRIALDAAMALALALEPINGVSRAVSAFPSLNGKSDRVTRVLGHGDRVAQHASAFVQSARGGTPMTGALWFAAADLLAQAAPRKVLITLSDGEPNQRSSVLDLLARARTAGIELIGIGIQHEVGHLFPVAIRIDDVADLKRTLFQVAEQLLLSHRH